MCKVIDFKNKNVIADVMSVDEAEAIVGEGLMYDELVSLKDICSDNSETVDACDVLIAVRHT